jgi:Zn-dependent M28 family amino/carboxypeptidase
MTHFKVCAFLLLFIGSIVSTFAQPNFDSIFQQPSLISYYVSALAHDSMQGRETGKAGMAKAASFIAQQMYTIGLKPVKGNEDFYAPYYKINPRDPYPGINVIGAIPGNGNINEMVIFSAHYDHLGKIKSKKDSVYNGANDNASGVSLMLQLAAYYIKTKPERTILFIAFSGEELGLKGSQAFVKDIKKKLVQAVINFDMVGRSTENKVYLSGWEYGTVMDELNQQLYLFDEKKYGSSYFQQDAPIVDFFRRSDNYPFAELGIPAHTVSTTADNDRYYHRPSDETSTIDFTLMNELVKTMFIATQSIVNGKTKLPRIYAD